MGTGILLCGLNGAGKSTLGKALAEELNFYFIDNEDLYFPKIDPNYMYAVSRTREEVEELFLSEIKEHENFVFASVTGAGYGGESFPFQYVVLLEIPRELRIQRVKERSFQKFGNRMLPGGDLYEKEERFLELVKSRAENMVEEWLQSLECPILRVDATKPVKENTAFLVEAVSKNNQ